MSELMNAMKTKDSFTENGAVTHSTSNDLCLDLFFNIGSMRKNQSQVANLFARAHAENPELATRILLWARDVRGGAGERATFRTLFKMIIKRDIALAERVMAKIPELGRWDDLIVAFGTPLESSAIVLWANAIVVDNNQLAAKWFPREKSKNGIVFKKTVATFNTTSRKWRKILSMVSDTVEQKMCAGEWADIDFGKLPSVAAARYQAAFTRNAPASYDEYKTKLETGEEKINAGAVYPYDVITSLKHGEPVVANAQWNALPNYMEGNDERLMPVVDVSGSMGYSAGGMSVTCMDVAISLGMYIADRNEGIFKDEFISFSSDPHFHKLVGDDLATRYNTMIRSGENMSTDITKVFEVLLSRAKDAGLSEDAMPTKLVILSDMEFDDCNTGSMWSPTPATNFEAIRELYKSAGYAMPQLVFWNLRGTVDNIPVKMNQDGVAMVSGFSPSIMTSFLGGELDPIKIMMKAVGSERYDF